MQITLNSLVLLFGVFSLAVSATEQTYPTFRLRAWRHYRSTDWPLSLFVEVDQKGNAVVNKTADYPGFDSYIKPSSTTPGGRPVGKMFSNNLQGGKTYKGYLEPLGKLTAPTSKATHYQLKFAKSIPNKRGVLSVRFTYEGRGCGGNCGGLTLDYDTDKKEGTYGEWYIVREDKKKKNKYGVEEPSPVWNIRWVPVINYAGGETFQIPEKALSVFMWV